MTAESATDAANNTAIPLMENGDAEQQKPNGSATKRSCADSWRILPVTYKIFIVLAALSVLLVGYLFVERYFGQQPVPFEKIPRALIPNPVVPQPPSPSKLHQFENGAVCSDAEACSNIGSAMLSRGGGVVDAAIATMFCTGIIVGQSAGIGGGFLMNLYLHDERKSITLNAKEVAPAAVHDDMFPDRQSYLDGVKAAGVPGEVKGYWELHQKYGKLEWKELIEPSIKICDEGFSLTLHMYDNIYESMRNDTNLNNIFFNHTTGKRVTPGSTIKWHKELCDTYRMLAENGGQDYYNGTLADLIVEDFKDFGGIITKEDLLAYETRWDESLSTTLADSILYVPTPPSGGVLTAFILNIINGYNFTVDSIATEDNRVLTTHRMIEAFKYAFGYRTQFTDPHFDNKADLIKKLMSHEYAEDVRHRIFDNQTFSDPKHYGGEFNVISDKGTSHISILAPNGDAISVTTSINIFFGNKKTGKRTGIIFNTSLNDFSVPKFENYFSLPPSPGNFMKPKKRPMTSMSPSILVDKASGDVRLVIGASGGTKIITALSTVISGLVWFNQTIKQAVDAPRVHHQLAPMELQYEFGNTQQLVDGLERLGHKTKRFDDRGSIVCAIIRNGTEVFANADYRKAGEVVGF